MRCCNGGAVHKSRHSAHIHTITNRMKKLFFQFDRMQFFCVCVIVWQTHICMYYVICARGALVFFTLLCFALLYFALLLKVGLLRYTHNKYSFFISLSLTVCNSLCSLLFEHNIHYNLDDCIFYYYMCPLLTVVVLVVVMMAVLLLPLRQSIGYVSVESHSGKQQQTREGRFW